MSQPGGSPPLQTLPKTQPHLPNPTVHRGLGNHPDGTWKYRADLPHWDEAAWNDDGRVPIRLMVSKRGHCDLVVPREFVQQHERNVAEKKFQWHVAAPAPTPSLPCHKVFDVSSAHHPELVKLLASLDERESDYVIVDHKRGGNSLFFAAQLSLELMDGIQISCDDLRQFVCDELRRNVGFYGLLMEGKGEAMHQDEWTDYIDMMRSKDPLVAPMWGGQLEACAWSRLGRCVSDCVVRERVCACVRPSLLHGLCFTFLGATSMS
jgi:hypothetical protein